MVLFTGCGTAPITQNGPPTPIEGPYTHQIYGLESPDSFTFMDQGEVFSYPGLVYPDVFYEDYEITDPSVIQLPDGTYKMVYKITAKPNKN